MPDFTPEVQKFSDALQAHGFRAMPSDDGSVIQSGAAGLRFALIPKARTVQFRCVMEGRSPQAFTFEHANRYNEQYRFGKVYIDSDSDIVLEADYYLNPNSPDFDDIFNNILSLWEGLAGLFRKDVEAANETFETESDA